MLDPHHLWKHPTDSLCLACSSVFSTRFLEWNFTKFLVDKEGNVIERYGSNTKPSAIAPTIEKLLSQ